jgi:hypothetical protein
MIKRDAAQFRTVLSVVGASCEYVALSIPYNQNDTPLYEVLKLNC